MATPAGAPTTDGKAEQQVGDLENNLRQMILSNVTISQGKDNHRSWNGSHQQSLPGRGRGRAKSFQGRGRPAAQFQSGHVQMLREYGAHIPATDFRPLGSPTHRSSSRHSMNPQIANNTAQGRAMNGPYVPQHPQKTQQQCLPPNWTPQVLQRPQQQPNQHQPSVPAHLRFQGRPNRPVYPQPSQPMVDPQAQSAYLEQVAMHEVSKVEIDSTELQEKEAFRSHLESLFQKALAENDAAGIATINLVAFGSLASGFATKGSDVDLAVVPIWEDPSQPHEGGIDQKIPRLLEKVTLDAEMGARLLTRTRVPILKICQKPTTELYQALLAERTKWDALPEEEKYAPPKPRAERAAKSPVDVEAYKSGPNVQDAQQFPSLKEVAQALKQTNPVSPKPASPMSTSTKDSEVESNNGDAKSKEQHQRLWLREKTQGPLDFPKLGVGIQCDINFENPLAIHNTHLLRCYSCCDPRVRPMVLFIKSWAKQRKINSSYSGTLSSYGWVLMVLHYLVNIVQPPVCPNLQTHVLKHVGQPANMEDQEQKPKSDIVAGYTVQFWRDQDQILSRARANQLTLNHDSVGTLLRGFFQYFASVTQAHAFGQRPRYFHWVNEILSLRTPGGIQLKQDKGWTGAKKTTVHGMEVRHRYLFCIEDPFEIDHNVARTVTHQGLVTIRDEFRRAWRILEAVGRGQPAEGGLFDEIVEVVPPTPKTSVTPGPEVHGQSVQGKSQVEIGDGSRPVVDGDGAGITKK